MQTIFIRIYQFSGDYAFGAFVCEDRTLIPFQMPVSAYQQAIEKKILNYEPNPTRDGAYSESPLLYFEQH